MRIVIARRISQVFFVALFLGFCVASSLGASWWQLRGWPVNWFLELDPLLALATVLTTGALYAGLLWALVTVLLTIILGRFFCGWVCPFGAMHQFIGWLGRRGLRSSQRLKKNQPHRYQSLKYHLLALLLSAAAAGLIGRLLDLPAGRTWLALTIGLIVVGMMTMLATRRAIKHSGRALLVTALLVAGWLALARWLPVGGGLAASLQSGLLDPIALVYRSVNLALLPLVDAGSHNLWSAGRVYQGAWIIGGLFLAALLLNLWRPRFYCRFLCPLGALMGLLGRFALWRMGRREAECQACGLCQLDCEGACQPDQQLIHSECVLCMNCLEGCQHDQLTFAAAKSPAGEKAMPDFSRRAMVGSLAAGLAVGPLSRLGGGLKRNWPPDVVRPPGALNEADFLARCTKCGQCMRVCPTNVIQPAWLEAGLEGIWTPVLNFRAGTSGCQLNCVACGNLCPTAAIRPLTLDQRLGRGEYAGQGPVRMGTAFLDRGRCLPWAMGRPCIVCQENCPVSPKAIFTRVEFHTIRQGGGRVESMEGETVRLKGAQMQPFRLATGDYYLAWPGEGGILRRRIAGNSENQVSLAPEAGGALPGPGSTVSLQVRLQKPQVDPAHCIGCGICQHECPVAGRPAIRVTAENQTRAGRRAFL